MTETIPKIFLKNFSLIFHYVSNAVVVGQSKHLKHDTARGKLDMTCTTGYKYSWTILTDKNKQKNTPAFSYQNPETISAPNILQSENEMNIKFVFSFSCVTHTSFASSQQSSIHTFSEGNNTDKRTL